MWSKTQISDFKFHITANLMLIHDVKTTILWSKNAQSVKNSKNLVRDPCVPSCTNDALYGETIATTITHPIEYFRMKN